MTKFQANFSDGFTVLMAVYHGDCSVTLKKAIESVLENTLQPKKFLLCADGPLTDVLEIEIQKWLNKFPNKIILIRCPQNMGLAHALNYGIKNIETEWIVRADADDINHKNRFQRLANCADFHPESVLIGSYIREVDECGILKGIRRVPLTCEEIYQYSKKRNPFNHMSVAYKKSAVIHSGLYPNLILKEDYGLWAAMIRDRHHMMNIDEILVDATVDKNFYSRRGGIKYIVSEFQLQKYLYKYQIKNLVESLIDFLIRGTVFCLPQKIRKIIYLIFLREK